MLKKYSDVYAGVFLMLIAVVMYIATFSIKMLTVSRIGSAFVPQLTAIGIFAVSIFIIAGGMRQARSVNGEPAEGGEQAETPNYRAVVYSLVLMTLYVALMSSVGFLITTVVYLFLQMYVLADASGRKMHWLLLISVVSSGVIYYIFRSVFNVMLPEGILG